MLLSANGSSLRVPCFGVAFRKLNGFKPIVGLQEKEHFPLRSQKSSERNACCKSAHSGIRGEGLPNIDVDEPNGCCSCGALKMAPSQKRTGPRLDCGFDAEKVPSREVTRGVFDAELGTKTLRRFCSSSSGARHADGK